MAGNSYTSQLVMELLDRVTGPARAVARSIRGVNNAARDGAGVRIPMTERLDAALARNRAALDRSRGSVAASAATLYVLAQAIGAPVRAASEFESAMADVRKVVDFPTPAAFDAFKRQLMDLSKEVPISVNGLAAIAAAAGQAGIKGAELVRFTEAAAKIGTAFDISADEAGTALAKLMTGLGLTLDEAVLLSDSMNHLSNSQASTAAEILDVVKRVGAQGKLFGFTATQTAGFASAMIAAGAESEVAATSFRNMGKALTKGESATNRQSAAFDTLGLSATDTAKRMQKDAVGTTIDVMERLSKLPKEMQAAVSSDLFGDEARALGPLLTNLDLVRDSLGLVADQSKYAGSAFKEFEVRNATFGSKIQRFRNVMQALSITIGSALLPVLSDMMEAIAPVIESITRFVEQNPKLLAGIISVTGGLIAMRGALALIRYSGLMAIGGALSTVGAGAARLWDGAAGALALQRALGRMSGGAGLGALNTLKTGLRGILFAIPGVGLLANAIGAIGAAVATISAPAWGAFAATAVVIGGIGMTIYKYWGRISAVFAGVAKRIGEALAPALEAIRPLLDWLAPIGQTIAAGWNAAKGALAGFWDWFTGLFAQEVLTEDQKARMEQAGYDAADRLIKGFLEIPAKLLALAQPMIDAGKALIQGLWDGAVAKFDEFIAWLQTIPARIAAAVGIVDLSGAIKVPGFGTRTPGSLPADNYQNPANEFSGVDGANAKGGPVSPGRTYLVGENGPEVISPTRGGFVHPNGAGGAQVSVVINPQMSFSGATAADADAIAGKVMGRIRDEIGMAMRGLMADAGMGA